MPAFQASVVSFFLTQVSVRYAHCNLGYDIPALRALGRTSQNFCQKNLCVKVWEQSR
jgi:hypothetical protein